MSIEHLVIDERTSDIGNFIVGRLLPFRKKRAVGPFVFVDHMGPAEVGNGHYMDIGQHPHIGLSTLTYLFEGSVMHRDSLGTQQLIQPREVNFMTAGKGIVHTERTPEAFRDGQIRNVHGFQIWIALPVEKEDMEPAFQHLGADELPHWKEDGFSFRLVAGRLGEHASPLQVYSPLYLMEIHCESGGTLQNKGDWYGEIGICIISGSATVDAEKITAGHLLVAKTTELCSLEIETGSHILLFGGEPFPEERFIHWNFVSSRREKIEQAKEDWMHQRFTPVPGETGYIPLPTP